MSSAHLHSVKIVRLRTGRQKPGTKKTACRAARRFASKTVDEAQSAVPGSRAVRCAMEIFRASGPNAISTISTTATIPTTSISA